MKASLDTNETYINIIKRINSCRTNNNINFEDLINLELSTLSNYGIQVSREQLLFDLDRLNEQEKRVTETDKLKETFRSISEEPKLNPKLEELKRQIELMRNANPSLYGGKQKVKK